MTIDLPPKITVRRLLRQQALRKKAYRNWFDRTYEKDWKRGKLKGEALYRFGKDFDAQFLALDPFQAERSGEPERLRTKSTKGFRTEGYVLWNVSYGHNFAMDASAYTEQAIMLARTGGTITANKATFYEAPLGFSWTRHALERLCERSAIGNDAALEEILQVTTLDIAQDLAVAATHELFKVHAKDDGWSQTIWIPYRDGLLVITGRYIAAPNFSREVGWRFNYINQKFSNVYIKKDLLQGDTQGSSHRADGRVIFASWFITTFIGANQLSEAQRKYVAAFKTVLAALPAARCTKAYRTWFDPDFKILDGDDTLACAAAKAAIDSAIEILAAPEFKAVPRSPVAYLLDEDLTSNEFDALPIAPQP